MKRIDIRPRKRNAPRPPWKIAASYLQWLRGRNCAVMSKKCEGRIEAAHTPDSHSKGMGTKAADYFAIPLCSFHHRRQHQIGWQSFAAESGIEDIEKWRGSYWFAWPGWKEWCRETSGKPPR